jgi:hypothetical protein
MWIFIAAGFLYLVGVAVILVLRPSFMFTPEGEWKEFGIGKRDDRYTPFPFWLFCLSWAIISYVLILILWPLLMTPSQQLVNRNAGVAEMVEPLPPPPPAGNRNRNRALQNQGAVELPKGYYVLNKKATRLSGVPKYVYLAPEA